MTAEEIIADILNNLITINKDRIVGYKEAIHDTKEDQVRIRRLFKKAVKQSEHFIRELKEKIKRLGAKVTDKTITTGLVYNTWMDIVYANSVEKPDIIHFCDQLEDTTLQAYDSALINIKGLDKIFYDLVLSQKQDLINSRNEI